MGLLDTVKSKINEENKIAMEEYDVLSSLDEDDDIILEAALRGEASIMGDDYDENTTLDDEDFASGDDTESEDPDLGEDEDILNFSFDSEVPAALESMTDEDEDDFDEDDEEDMDTLFDRIADDVSSDEEDEF